jgi:hypothetical protein
MISYYKFTNGDAFTLGGKDYEGFFNVKDGEAFTGRTRTDTSLALSAKSNFITFAFLDEREFDNNVTSSTTNLVSSLNYSPRNILSNDFLKKNFRTLFENNLSLFSLSQVYNPSLYNSASNSDKLSSCAFFGLSSTTIDSRNDDRVAIKNLTQPYQIDPFSGADKNIFPEYYELDNTTESFVETYQDGFIYTISTDTKTVAFSGSFGGNLENLSLVTFDNDNKLLDIYVDKANHLIYSLDIQSSVPFVNIFDEKIYRSCQTLKLIDRIKVSDNKLVNNNIGYSKKYKGALVSNNQGDVLIELSLKNETEVLKTIQLSDLNDPEYVKIALRGHDDLLLIVTKPVSNVSEFLIYKIDLEDFFETSFIPEPLKSTRIDYDNQFRYKSPKKSDSSYTVFGTNNNRTGYFYPLFKERDDAQKISKGGTVSTLTFPEFPNTVFYFTPDYLFFKEDRPIGYFIYRNTDTNIDLDVIFSEFDSNLFTINDNSNISQRLLSNPDPTISVLNRNDLNLPPDLLFDNTEYLFADNQWKWNTNLLESNRVAFKNVLIDTIDNEVVLYLHNVGRLYYTKLKDKTDSLVKRDLECLFDETLFDSICETGIGINLNTLIQDILRDTLNIYNGFTKIPKGRKFYGTELLLDSKLPESIDINVRNFYFHSNESVNYLSINRVFSKLFELQKAIYDSILTS